MINVKNLKKSFHNSFRPVLDGINFSIDQGDFCTLIGANGCGKSTLFKIISGEYKPDAGKIIRKGEVSQVVQDIDVGTVPQMTMLENIALCVVKSPRLSLYTRHSEMILRKINELDPSLEKYLNLPLKVLSGGQRQTIATLMAVNSGREILLLDEHTSALDPKMQPALMEYTCQQIEKQNLTTIMITHKMDDALKYGNRLLMLHQGKVVLDINEKEKRKLNLQDLLSMFHHYENQILLSRE